MALFELKLNVPLVLKDLQNHNSAYTLKPWSLILFCLAFCGILWTYLFMLIRSLKKNSSLIKSKWSFQAGGCVIAGENAHTGWVCRILLAWLAKEWNCWCRSSPLLTCFLGWADYREDFWAYFLTCRSSNQKVWWIGVAFWRTTERISEAMRGNVTEFSWPIYATSFRVSFYLECNCAWPNSVLRGDTEVLQNLVAGTPEAMSLGTLSA